MNFENLNLHPGIMTGVHELGYIELTPIQTESIPPILQGRDVIGLAQTGTSKTAAFVLLMHRTKRITAKVAEYLADRTLKKEP